MRDGVQRMFSMSAFEALKHLRSYRKAHPQLTDTDLIALTTRMEIGALDYDAAAMLDLLIPEASEIDHPVRFLRACIEAALVQNPIWSRLVTLGRQKFIQKISRDEVSCFRCAQLLDEPPSEETVAWWDRIQSNGRTISAASAMDQARRAERLSLAFETERLKILGISRAPTWMAIEDNTVGYDILSFDAGEAEPISRLIEVKSFRGSGRFYVTRNEWRTALKFGPRYVFHIWDMDRNKLHERTVSELMPQIPTDGDGGEWNNAILILLAA
ncbi:DUF3883 domain-containing protein [Bradyrhizobium erythrophlei]|uniref:Protein NO VEIN C-terminal domain-containing protein n=1 Tax=Bradyrhizobium erythrophlei TaxID=1437360 RepID=A0A1M5PZB2_9BRAD|nr:DUF3883 domain-containing protein [Bradyrhizobium erythrophlei]SHH07030.1 protein of unknown function [Bradyrhizobium erythrophlei]